MLREVVDSIEKKWLVAYHDSENEYYIGSSDDESEFQDAEWSYEANAIMKDIQEAVLVTSYGSGFTMHDVHNDVLQELEAMAYWRAKEWHVVGSLEKWVVGIKRLESYLIMM